MADVDSLLPFFQPASFSSSGLPDLEENEFIYISKQASLPTTHHEQNFGMLMLTDRRIIFMGDASCRIAGSLSAIVSQVSPARMFSRSTRLVVTLNSSVKLPREIQLKFQSHSDAEEFSEKFQISLDRKNWMLIEKEKENKSKVGVGPRAVGISGIMRQHEREKRETKTLASDSFKDLEALFSKANSVVQIITKYQAQIENMPSTLSTMGSIGTDGSSLSSQDEAQQMRELLMTIGIRSPVTKSSSGNLFHQNLARELADFLLKNKHLEKSGGTLSLLEVYCIWNRARPLAMVSPDDLIECTKLLKVLSLKMSLRKFESGLIVIQADTHGDTAMCENLEKIALEKGSIHSFQVSQLLGIPLALANEHIKIAEERGYLCRDEYLEQLSFYPNKFNEFSVLISYNPTSKVQYKDSI